MPFLITPDKAAEYIFKELPKSNFEIYFPKRFAWIMKTLRIIPYRIYFALTNSAVTASPPSTKDIDPKNQGGHA